MIISYMQFSPSRLKLLVDDMPNSKAVVTPERKSMNRPIKLGGNNFEGCMSNVFIER